MVQKGTVKLEKKDQIAYMTFNRPEKGNALTYEDYETFRDMVLELDKDKAIRVLIITGAGDRFFSAGDDLGEYPGADDTNPWSGEKNIPKLITQIHAAVVGWRHFWEWDKITITALNGICSVAEMVYFSDFVIASENATIGQPEVGMGVMPGGGGTQMLPRLVGIRRAMEICLLSEYMSAEEAYRIGLVNKVVPLSELMPTAEALAQKVLAMPPASLNLCKKAILKAQDIPLDEGMLIERAYCNSLSQTEDFAARMKAFMAKKPTPPPIGR
jgi:enoyl-CoA hydratase